MLRTRGRNERGLAVGPGAKAGYGARMSLGVAFVTGIGLAADACAVAAARSLSAGAPDWRQALRLGAVFGAFQGVMPLLGAGVALIAVDAMAQYDHWVAFVVLVGIGLKLVWDARTGCGDTGAGWPSGRTLLLLGIATSIDAAAAGVGLAALGRVVWIDGLIIAGITVVLSTLAAGIAPRLGRCFGRYAGLVGGLLLITLGSWILVTHLADHG